jgi:acyl-CoA dehydrogenase
VQHARDRVQFGRPIGRFQAVQAHLVTIAQQAALAGVAVDAAIEREGAFEIAAAKLLASRAALTAGRAAHQVLGARGVTLEHPLSLETRRLWSWRSECGDERYWSERLGSAAGLGGADRLYPAITAGSAELEV